MNRLSQQRLQSALSLPESERAEIAASLIRSLDAESDPDVDGAWAAEIERRIQSVDSGAVHVGDKTGADFLARIIEWRRRISEIADVDS